MKILISQDTSKKGTRKKVHLGNRLLLLRKIRSEDFIYFIDKAWRCGLVVSGDYFYQFIGKVTDDM